MTYVQMPKMKILSAINGEKVEYQVENYFEASENPLYLGVIVKPSPGLWELLSRSKTVVVVTDNLPITHSITYRIEVGESSIFFLTPKE